MNYKEFLIKNYKPKENINIFECDIDELLGWMANFAKFPTTNNPLEIFRYLELSKTDKQFLYQFGVTFKEFLETLTGHEKRELLFIFNDNFIVEEE